MLDDTESLHPGLLFFYLLSALWFLSSKCLPQPPGKTPGLHLFWLDIVPTQPSPRLSFAVLHILSDSGKGVALGMADPSCGRCSLRPHMGCVLRPPRWSSAGICYYHRSATTWVKYFSLLFQQLPYHGNSLLRCQRFILGLLITMSYFSTHCGSEGDSS